MSGLASVDAVAAAISPYLSSLGRRTAALIASLMTAADIACPQRNSVERLFDALADPARGERIMVALLAGYAAVWGLYGAIAHSSQDIHIDMGEMFAWSHLITWSSPTHPPLGAWLTRAWFSVMPRQDWSFYLFAILVATVALWIAWRFAGRYLTAEKRIAGIALLTLLPFYNFHAFKFNASSVLMPFWAATTLWFLRSLETRRAAAAGLAGVFAGLSMLGKYWSLLLLAGLAVAALCDPRRKAYFRSAAPWLTAAAGAIVLAPHLAFIATHGFTTFHFALTAHRATFGQAALGVIGFIGGTIGYLAVALILAALATRPDAAAIRDTLWPAAAERRTILIAFAAPFLIAALIGLLLRDELVSLWMIGGVTLLPVVLLSSPRVKLARAAAVRLLALALGYPLVALAVSPAVAIVVHYKGLSDYQTQYRLIAEAVEAAWHRRTNAPLKIVASYRNVADGSNFYFDGYPATYDVNGPPRTPWVDADRMDRDGMAIVCPVKEFACMINLQILAARYPATATIETAKLARRYFGSAETPVTYVILIVPPPKP